MRRFLIVCTLVISMALSLNAFAGDLYGDNPRYVDGELLVKFNEDVIPTISGNNSLVTVGIIEADRLFTRFGATGFGSLYGDYVIKDLEYRDMTRNELKIKFPSGTDMELVAQEFAQLPTVEWAYPNALLPLFYQPNDPSINSQWFHEQIESRRAWDVVQGDSTIIVAALDTGVDWNHPDLWGNIWVNPGEDIDGDPRPAGDIFPDMPGTLGDWNDTDDDDNGLIDDFIGYDWVSGVNGHPDEDSNTPDNNPIDFNGHGTGCSGAMAQVGDNGIGGAGVAYKSKIMCLRVGYSAPDGNGFTQLASAVTSLLYARDNGAKIINMSFGGNSPYTPMNNAVQSAWNNNMLLFGAAGNDNSSQIQYPANYDHVISVAATEQNDNRAYFSNYGTWVDISAPGVDCLTAWFDDQYSSWQGTSVATPIAAGLGALVMQVFPNEDNSFWSDVIINTTDPDNSAQPIGSGRVNAYKAVTQYYWPELSFEEINIEGMGGNGHPDAGETITITMSVSNSEGWLDAQLAMARVDLDINGVTYNTQEVMLGNIPAGGSANNDGTPLSFTIPADGPDGVFANMTITVSADPNDYSLQDERRLLIGIPEFILVDDDGGATYDSYLTSDFEEMNMVYAHHDVAALANSPTAEDLNQFEFIFWMTGDVENPLDQDEIAALQGAMDAGKKVFLFGQTLDEQLSGTDFYANYLHAESATGAPTLVLESIEDAGGPIMNDSQLVLNGPGGAGNNDDPDVITPLDGAVAAYQYLNSTDPGGLYYTDNNYYLMYFAFAFEAASGFQSTTTRREVIQGMLEWCGTGVENEAKQPVPSNFDIVSAYPNPFNPSTTLQVAVPQTGDVSVKIYDVLGREVAELVNNTLTPGVHNFSWNAAGQATGIYFAVMQAEGVKKMTKLAYVK